jgi:hypothetical protein
MLNYCGGQYTPGEVANATLPLSNIKKNVTSCSASRAAYKFDPTSIIQAALNNSTLGRKVTLKNLKWPKDIDNGIKALNALTAAMFVLYIISICLIFVALLATLFTLVSMDRLSAYVDLMLGTLAFLAIGLASALVTAVMVKATDLVNEYGNGIGVEARYGKKFLALTWVATGLMLVVVGCRMEEFCVERSKRGSCAGSW